MHRAITVAGFGPARPTRIYDAARPCISVHLLEAMLFFSQVFPLIFFCDFSWLCCARPMGGASRECRGVGEKRGTTSSPPRSWTWKGIVACLALFISRRERCSLSSHSGSQRSNLDCTSLNPVAPDGVVGYPGRLVGADKVCGCHARPAQNIRGRRAAFLSRRRRLSSPSVVA